MLRRLGRRPAAHGTAGAYGQVDGGVVHLWPRVVDASCALDGILVPVAAPDAPRESGVDGRRDRAYRKPKQRTQRMRVPKACCDSLHDRYARACEQLILSSEGKCMQQRRLSTLIASLAQRERRPPSLASRGAAHHGMRFAREDPWRDAVWLARCHLDQRFGGPVWGRLGQRRAGEALVHACSPVGAPHACAPP